MRNKHWILLLKCELLAQAAYALEALFTNIFLPVAHRQAALHAAMPASQKPLWGQVFCRSQSQGFLWFQQRTYTAQAAHGTHGRPWPKMQPQRRVSLLGGKAVLLWGAGPALALLPAGAPAGTMRSAPVLASLSRTRRVMDWVLPSGPVNMNSVCCGLTQVSCVRRERPADSISTQTPSTQWTL